MKKTTIALFSLLASFSISAQEVISSQGETYSNTNGVIDFTIGEVIINTGTNGTNDITQGFHQTNWVFVGLDNFAPNYEVSVYPNPSEELLNIRTKTFENVSYTLYDAVGKVILQDKLSSEFTTITVNQLAPGSYSLTLNNSAQNLKTFKLTKLSK